MVRTVIVPALNLGRRSVFPARLISVLGACAPVSRRTGAPLVAAAAVRMPAATATVHTLAKKVPMGAPDGNSGGIHNAECVVREQTNKGFT